MGNSTYTSSPYFGCISPRTATLALAVAGIILHLNVYSWLGSLGAALPDVPQRRLVSQASALSASSPDKFTKSAARIDQLVDMGAYSQDADTPLAAEKTNEKYLNNYNNLLPDWIAETKAYLKAQGLSFVPSSGPGLSSSENSLSSKYAPANQETNSHRWSNWQGLRMGPSSVTPDTSTHNEALRYQLDDGAEEAERLQWDALRLVIGTLRWYIFVSVLCCCAGVVGVIRSQLLLSRLFVIHSFLDLLLSTLSLLALAIICTYPSVRSHMCDDFGSSELQSFFSHSGSSSSNRSAQLGASAGTQMGLVGGIGAASGRGLGTSAPGTVDVPASGWETILDGVFGSENCEESFRSTLVPLLLLFGLVFAAVRLQCFFVVQRFYASLLRVKLYTLGYASTSSSGDTTPMSMSMPTSLSIPMETRDRRWKEDKLLD